MSGVSPVVLEPVEVLVSLAANLATVRFVFLHAGTIEVRGVGLRVNDGKGPVFVLFERLVLVAMQTVIFEAVLVLIGFFTADHRTLERLIFFILHHIQVSSWIVNIHAVGVGVCHLRIHLMGRKMPLLMLVTVVVVGRTISGAGMGYRPRNGPLGNRLVL